LNSIEVHHVWKKFKLTNGARSLSQILKFPYKSNKHVKQNDFWALKDISFTVKAGEGLGIIGSNGSGKSTLLKLLTNIMVPTKGTIHVNGRVSALIELGAGFHPDFTGRENVYINGLMLGMSKKEIDYKFDEIVEFAELESFIDVPVKYYSSGMQARLGFSVATSVEPEILIVDEVLAVGDADFQQKCRIRIQNMQKNGVTLVLVSHSTSDIEAICNKTLWIHKGSTIMLNDTKQVLEVFNQNFGVPS
jgi:ABC-2 type transport system ATP-binding protein